MATGRAGRRWLWGALALALTAGAAVVLLWFEPQRLLDDDRVDEPIPTAAAERDEPATRDRTAEPTTPADPAEPAGPVDLHRGEFVSLDHGTSGAVRVLELADGRRVIRLEGLDTSNGPDLYVYLSTNAAAGDEGAFDDDVVDLGRLKGNLGDQNYDVPADVDIGRYASVVIWCDRFDSAFGAADLRAA